MANIPGSVPLVGLVRLQPSAPDGTSSFDDNSFIGQPVNNPKMPYAGPLPSLCDGFMVIIQGYFLPDAINCEFGFSCRSPHADGVAFHIKIGFNTNGSTIVRNSFRAGAWDLEEKGDLCSTLANGRLFECIILVTNCVYKVAFNGIHAFDFTHRFPLNTVSGLKLDGDMTVERVFFQGPGSCAMPALSGQLSATTSTISMPALQTPSPPSTTSSVQLPTIGFNLSPFSGFNLPVIANVLAAPTINNLNKYTASKVFPDGLRHGQVFNIYGCVHPNACWFAVSLKSIENSPDIAFNIHIDLLKQTIIRSNCKEGAFGPNESFIPYFPFRKGEHYNICILCQHDRFMMAVNGNHLIEFFHRGVALSEIHWLMVAGDVSVSNIIL